MVSKPAYILELSGTQKKKQRKKKKNSDLVVWGGDLALVCFKSSPGNSNMLPELRNAAVGRSKPEAKLSSNVCFENTKLEFWMSVIGIKKA